jgi:hypothetical protein
MYYIILKLCYLIFAYRQSSAVFFILPISGVCFLLVKGYRVNFRETKKVPSGVTVDVFLIEKLFKFDFWLYTE